MTIRASDIAFRDLTLKSIPRELADEPRDRSSLSRRVTVVEVKDNWVRLAAVNAGMLDEIVEDLLTAFLTVELPVSGGALQIRWTVSSVMFACVRCLAG